MPEQFDDGGQGEFLASRMSGTFSEGAARKLCFEQENQIRMLKQEVEYRKKRDEKLTYVAADITGKLADAEIELGALRARYREAVEALEECATWSQELQDRLELHGNAIAYWRGVVAVATAALAKARTASCRPPADRGRGAEEAEEPKWLPLPLGHHFDKDDHWPDHCAAYIGGSPSEDSSYCGRPASEHER